MFGHVMNILTLIGMVLALLQYPLFQRMVFKLMMYMYPKSFRVKYMDEMCETFIDSIEYHMTDGGSLGGFVVVAKEFFGIAKGATEVRYDKIKTASRITSDSAKRRFEDNLLLLGLFTDQVADNISNWIGPSEADFERAEMFEKMIEDLRSRDQDRLR